MIQFAPYKYCMLDTSCARRLHHRISAHFPLVRLKRGYLCTELAALCTASTEDSFAPPGKTPSYLKLTVPHGNYITSLTRLQPHSSRSCATAYAGLFVFRRLNSNRRRLALLMKDVVRHTLYLHHCPHWGWKYRVVTLFMAGAHEVILLNA